MQPPKILTENGLSLFVNDTSYRDMNLPIIDLNIGELTWHFDMSVWGKDNTDDWNLTPREVLNNEEYTKEHRQRISDVDIEYPLIITKYKDKYVILDGIHRLCKAYELGKEFIKCKIIPSEVLSLRDR